MRFFRLVGCAWLLWGAFTAPALQAAPAVTGFEAQLDAFTALVPTDPAGLTPQRVEKLAKQVLVVEQSAVEVALRAEDAPAERVIQDTRRIVAGKRRVDQLLDEVLKLRTQFASAASPFDPRPVCLFLAATSEVINLSGRLRYLQYDILESAMYQLAESPDKLERLLDMLIEERCGMGAIVISQAILSPEAIEGPSPTFTPRIESKALDLVGITGEIELLPSVAAFVVNRRQNPLLILAAIEAIRRVGLPQDPRPQQDPDLPKPAITTQELIKILSALDPSQLNANDARRRSELLAWLETAAKEGLTDDSYTLGRIQVQAGDWLLMRNPSPYNLFTNLSPGLFTHVGVMAVETGTDGKRRMVVVDLPERGTQMPATNADLFVQRTLHYVLLRDGDAACCNKMAEGAASVIGNETEFDLTFRMDGVSALNGKPLAGERIKGYCAGLLVLMAGQTTVPLSEYFPLPEGAAGGHTTTNLAKLGLSMGESFVSPTGAIFSPRMQIVGRREPMYEPRREIEEAIYDHFASRLAEKELIPSQNWTQALRQKLAEASRFNKLLAEALANTAGISPNADLVSAAKAAAVVETLDEVAQGASSEFFAARDAIRMAPPGELANIGLGAEELALARKMQARHADLVKRWYADQLTPRQLRTSLAAYYIRQGEGQIDARFFAGQ